MCEHIWNQNVIRTLLAVCAVITIILLCFKAELGIWSFYFYGFGIITIIPFAKCYQATTLFLILFLFLYIYLHFLAVNMNKVFFLKTDDNHYTTRLNIESFSFTSGRYAVCYEYIQNIESSYTHKITFSSSFPLFSHTIYMRCMNAEMNISSACRSSSIIYEWNVVIKFCISKEKIGWGSQ